MNEGRRKRLIYVNCEPQLKTDDPYKVGVLNAHNSWIIIGKKPEFEVRVLLSTCFLGLMDSR
jgi:hypothetical protein